MNPVDNDGGTPQQDEHAQGQHETSGFASVMARLKNSDAAEREALAARTETVVVGYEAYAIGQQHLARGAHAAAGRWLKIAARHGVPGAEQALAELATQAPSGLAAFTAHDGQTALVEVEPLDCLPQTTQYLPRGRGTDHSTGSWGLVLDWQSGQEARAARAEAEQITLQAGRHADETLAQARAEAERITLQADQQASEALAQARADAAAILSEAERLHGVVRRQARDTADNLAESELLLEEIFTSRGELRDNGMAEVLRRLRALAGDTDVFQWKRFGKAASEGGRPLRGEQPAARHDVMTAPLLFQDRPSDAPDNGAGAPFELAWTPATHGVLVFRCEAQSTAVQEDPYACHPPTVPSPVAPRGDGEGPYTPILWGLRSGMALIMGALSDECAGEASYPLFITREKSRRETAPSASPVRHRYSRGADVTVHGSTVYHVALATRPTYPHHDENGAEQDRNEPPATSQDAVRDWHDSAGVGTPSG